VIDDDDDDDDDPLSQRLLRKQLVQCTVWGSGRENAILPVKGEFHFQWHCLVY